MSRRSVKYCAFGPVRGDCGHEHPTARGALACVQMDQAAQAELGLTSDREVCVIERDGTRRPVWPGEEE